mgnify:CR=1 FL=1|jgi:Shikimate kinase
MMPRDDRDDVEQKSPPPPGYPLGAPLPALRSAPDWEERGEKERDRAGSPKPLPTNIALIGFMGTGKSTVGRALARRLGWRYVDTDARIEAIAGCDIPTLFACEGEAAFRAREAQVVLGLAAGAGQVIATGGGVPLRAENAAALRTAGLVVYLTARPDVIVARTERRAADRPLLANRGDRDLLTHVMALLGERAPRYQQAAHLIVDTSDRSPENIAAEVARKAEKWAVGAAVSAASAAGEGR